LASWKDIQNEIKAVGTAHDVVRRRYLKALSDLTGRNTIVYYSGWQQFRDQRLAFCGIDDSDKHGMMTAVHGLDRKKGLDLILHTPGGDVGATESLIEYLREMFGTNIRAIVPHLSMSGGTMIALACREVIMGKHSRIGPVDPQIVGYSAHGVLEEFDRAYREIKKDQAKLLVWQPIIAKYPPTLIGECEKAMAWASEIVRGNLVSGMFKEQKDPAKRAERVLGTLASHAETKSHGRHISLKRARSLGIQVSALETDQKLQDAVLSIHHACIQSITASSLFKLIENQDGVAFVSRGTLSERPSQDGPSETHSES
jgi:hypothetical protein